MWRNRRPERRTARDARARQDIGDTGDNRSIGDTGDIEARSRAFLDELELPPVDGVFGLAPFMEEYNGRALQLVPFTPDANDPVLLDPSDPCGLWLGTATQDYVFYDAGISRAHAEMIVGHEFAHMLRGHRGVASLGLDGIDDLITDIDLSTVRLILGRTRYNEPDEYEAEMLGSLLQEHVHASAPRSAATDPITRTLLR